MQNHYLCTHKRSDARVAEEARLESVYTPKAYPEFESRSLRKIKRWHSSNIEGGRRFFVVTYIRHWNMAVSNRIKRNIHFGLTILGCVILVVRILDPIIERGSIDGNGWFEIFGACVITYLAYDNFKIYRKRVRNGIMFGDGKP